MNEVHEGFDPLPDVASRMEEALDALGTDTAAMVLSELNGYLSGIITCPEQIPQPEWLPEIWGGTDKDGNSPFADANALQAFTACVMEYYNSLITELGELAYAPIYDIDPDTNEVIWEVWTFGFTRAFDLRPEAWETYLENEDEDVADAMMQMLGLIAVAAPDPEVDEALTGEDIDEIQEAAPDLIPYVVNTLYHAGKQLH